MKRMILSILSVAVLMQIVILESFAVSGVIRVLMEREGEVTLYKVGVPEGDRHRLSAQYGGGTVSFDDVLSDDLAAWLAQRAKDGITREITEGTAEYTGLEEGLYLVVQSKGEKNQTPFSPFLVILPWDGAMWEVEVSPKTADSPETGDDIGFMLLCTVCSFAGVALWGKKKLLTKSAQTVIMSKHACESVGMVDKHV